MAPPGLLEQRVRPVALAGERTLAVDAALAPLLPDGALRRGTIVACQGVAAASLALALVAEASRRGSWVGLVGLPALGIAAATELGVATERLVRIEPAAGQRLAALAALVDGVDVVLTTGVGVRPGDARRLSARLLSKGALLVVVGAVGGFVPDLECRVVATRWHGLQRGHGRLAARHVTIESAGRRAGRPRQVQVWLPAEGGALAPAGYVDEMAPVGGTGAQIACAG
jgi:hypothetical protein